MIPPSDPSPDNQPDRDASASINPSAKRDSIGWQAHRSRHRSQQHSDAHADGKPFVAPDIADHAMVPVDEPEMLTGQQALLDLVADLRAAGQFGFDTEFIGENTYVPRLCLIQAATDKRLVLIDPFTLDDLTPWFELIADPDVEKVVHAGEQDLGPVARLLGKPPANIFDTQIAAGFIDLDYPMSLVRLVAELIGDDLDAGAKFSQWDRRPLTERQQHYAASDVRYLAAMRLEIGNRLKSTGNTQWSRHACQELCEMQRYEPDPLSRKIKSKGVNKLSRKKRSVLNRLLLWREDLAQQLNLPPRALLPDDAVHGIADALPSSDKQLAGVKYLPRPVREQYGSSMLETIKDALAGPLPKKTRAARYDREDHRKKVHQLWERIAEQCESQSINPSAITSKRELGPLVAAALEGRKIPRIAVNTGWRAQLLGPIIHDDQLIPEPPPEP